MAKRTIVPTYRDFERILKGDKRYESQLWTPPVLRVGFAQIFNWNSSRFQANPKYPESIDVAESDWKFRAPWGQPIKGDLEYEGLLKELPANIWHLGQPNISGAKYFWN